VFRLSETLRRQTGETNLCLAGGVALNCVINGQLLRDGPFENIWVQPAAGDAGGAIGIAQTVAYTMQDAPRVIAEPDGMSGSYLGPRFDDAQIRSAVDDLGAVYHRMEDAELYDCVARALADEHVVGWFQGRMEFGPRALGNRSILADPRSTGMQRLLNLKIKYRESFRPFAPAVLRDDASDYFELDRDSPYMLLVAPVRKERRRALSPEEKSLEGLDKLQAVRSDLPAITHVDHSARVQTVTTQSNPRLHRLLATFKSVSGCSVLVNTSFNVADEPIVCTPLDAYKCFLGSEMDTLVIENFVFHKEEQ
jgi:carbamoyltransferase